MKVLSLVGARPQFIKEAVLHEKFKERGIEEILVHSGQHYDFNMSDVFFKVLNIRKPDYNLKVGSGTHAQMTGKIMIEFEKVVAREKPDLIIVYGDTNTTMAGALVGAKLKIPVAHVEAGIRQKPKDMPEEINRVVTDHVSRILFAPSRLALENLKKEGITEGVYFTGDIMYDLFLKMKEHFDHSILNEVGLEEGRYTVVTIHRDFNVDDEMNLRSILKNLRLIAREENVIFPIHPRTRKRIKEFGFERMTRGIKIVEPLDYLKMMSLVCKSSRVITDSGGLQKEAYFCGKRAVVVMPDTGWKELIEVGWNVLSNTREIYEKWREIERDANYVGNIYGDGNSAGKMVDIMESHLSNYSIES